VAVHIEAVSLLTGSSALVGVKFRYLPSVVLAHGPEENDQEIDSLNSFFF